MSSPLPPIDMNSSFADTSVESECSSGDSGVSAPFSMDNWKSSVNPLKRFENNIFSDTNHAVMTGYTGHRRGSFGKDNYIPERHIDEATLGYNGWYNGKVVHAAIGRTSHAKTETSKKLEEFRSLCSGSAFTDSFHSGQSSPAAMSPEGSPMNGVMMKGSRAFSPIAHDRRNSTDFDENDDADFRQPAMFTVNSPSLGPMATNSPNAVSTANSRASSAASPSSRSSSRFIRGYTGFVRTEPEGLKFDMEPKKVAPVLGYSGYYPGKIKCRIESTAQHPNSYAEKLKQQVYDQRLREEAAAVKAGNTKGAVEFGSDMYYHKSRTFRSPVRNPAEVL